MEGVCAVTREVNGRAVIKLILKGLKAHGTLTLKETSRVITYSLLRCHCVCHSRRYARPARRLLLLVSSR